MGADLLIEYAPADVEIEAKKQIVASFDDLALAEALEQIEGESPLVADDPEATVEAEAEFAATHDGEDWRDYTRRRLCESLDILYSDDAHERDLFELNIGPYSVLLAGGMSYGDDPSEPFGAITALWAAGVFTDADLRSQRDDAPVPTPPAAATWDDNPLFAWLGEMRTRLQAGERPESVESPFGTHGVNYGEEDGERFATVGFVLPDGVFAEIEDGTYGQLNGFRVFLDEAHD